MCFPNQILKYKSNLSSFCTVDIRGLSQKVRASAHSHTAKGHPMYQARLTLVRLLGKPHARESKDMFRSSHRGRPCTTLEKNELFSFQILSIGG